MTALRFFVIRPASCRRGAMASSRPSSRADADAVLLPLWVFPLSGVWQAAAWVTMVLAVLVTVLTGLDYLLKARRLRQTSERAEMKRSTRRARRTRAERR